LPTVLVEILRRDDVDLRAGQERFHAHVDHEAALDDSLDLALHQATLFVDLDDLVPVLLVGRFFLGEDHHALIVFEALQKNFHLITHFEFFVSIGNRNRALGLVADVDETTCCLISRMRPLTIEFFRKVR